MEAKRWSSDDLGATFESQPLDDDLRTQAEPWREQLLEALGDEDDEIAELYLAGEPIPVEKLRATIRQVCLQNRGVPVLCGSALRNKGIQPLLDAVVDFLPAPVELPPVKGTNPKTGQPVEFERTRGGPFCGVAFKVQLWEGRKHTYLRIYSGTVSASSAVFNANKGVDEKIARLLKLHADKKERLQKAQAGDIVGVVGLKLATTGDTLCTREQPVQFGDMEFMTPVISMAVEPKTGRDEEKLNEVLVKMVEEDPTFTVTEDPDTGQTILSGMGELHLEIICDRLVREFHVPVNVGKPQVVFRETLKGLAEASERFERAFDEEGKTKKMFAEVTLAAEPAERGRGIEFFDKYVPPEDAHPIPKDWIRAVESGVREAAGSGPETGYPMVDLRVRLKSLKTREGETTDISLHIAAAAAFRKLCQKAGSAVLLPVMSLEVVTPEEFTGTVIGDINARGGKVEELVKKATRSVIKARTPMTKMFGYSTDLRSLTEGRATFSMHFLKFDVV
jgi:elongation factor G